MVERLFIVSCSSSFLYCILLKLISLYIKKNTFFFSQWKSDKIGRTQAMPHLKCYTRISPDESEIAWFFLTSANLSKGAMGKMLRNGTVQTLCNYEAGVLFLPQLIVSPIYRQYV